MAYIEGDGPRANLYHLLWQKDGPYIEKSSIRIPDTFIFVEGKPTMWYFTNLQGKIMRKRFQNITFYNILHKLISNCSDNDIVASFITTEAVKVGDKLLNFYKESEASNDTRQISKCPIEYYTASDFKKLFTSSAWKGKNGILQRFVKPYGQHNEMIQAIWSPKICIFTKKVNSKRLDETKYDANERALTFEGPDYCSQTIPALSKNLPIKIREACETLAHHLTNVSYEQVSIQRLVAYFKVDTQERVYFLWAGSIRIKEFSQVKRRYSAGRERPASLEPGVILNKSFSQIKQRKDKSFSNENIEQKNCINCDSKVITQFCPVSYKLLIQYLELSEKNSSRLAFNHSNKEFSNQILKMKMINTPIISYTQQYMNMIPAFIRKLYPELRMKEYYSLRRQDQFLLQNTYICEECFLNVTKKLEEQKKAVFLSKNSSFKPHRPLSSMRSNSRGSVSGISSVFRRRSVVNQTIDEENILEVAEHDKSEEGEKPEIIKLVAKTRPNSTSKIPSETALHSNASMTTLCSNVPSFLALRRSVFSNRRDSQSFLEKSELECLSQNQKSSPARLKNFRISEQLNIIADQLENRPFSVNEVQDFSPLIPHQSQPSGATSDQIESLNHLKNRRKIKSRQRSIHRNFDDIDELMRASIENFPITNIKEGRENGPEILLRRNSKNRSGIIYLHFNNELILPENNERKKLDEDAEKKSKQELNISLVNSQENNSQDLEREKKKVNQNFFIKKDYMIKPSKKFSSNSNNPQAFTSYPRKNKDSEKIEQITAIFKKDQEKSLIENQMPSKKKKERNQRSLQMKKVYLAQINITQAQKGSKN